MDTVTRFTPINFARNAIIISTLAPITSSIYFEAALTLPAAILLNESNTAFANVSICFILSAKNSKAVVPM